MTLLQKLNDQGWFLTEEGISKLIDATITGNGKASTGSSQPDLKKVIATALNWDLRDIAVGALPTKRIDSIPGRIVLQVMKVRNISAPKCNEESKVAPRLLQLDLTDGQNIIQALEASSVPELNLNMAPGTKIYFRTPNLELINGMLNIGKNDIEVLGGRVEALYEKWELTRRMLKYARNGRRMSGISGPPPWIPFGKNVQRELNALTNEKNFKSLQLTTENKENEEFNNMRSEAIARATKRASKKVFGGGGQQILDHNVKKILEKGYTESEAKQALRNTNNNLERALYNLKRRQPNKMKEEVPKSTFSNKSHINSLSSGKEDAASTKPAVNVCLSDFLSAKLPTNDHTTATNAFNSPSDANGESNCFVANSNINTDKNFNTPQFSKSKSDLTYNKTQKAQDAVTRTKFENNMSSSFANRTSGSSRGRRGGGGGGGGGSSSNGGGGVGGNNNGERVDRSARDNYNGNARYGKGTRNRNDRGASSAPRQVPASSSNKAGGEESSGGRNSVPREAPKEKNVPPRGSGMAKSRSNRSSYDREDPTNSERLPHEVNGADGRRNNDYRAQQRQVNDNRNFEKRGETKMKNSKSYNGNRQQYTNNAGNPGNARGTAVNTNNTPNSNENNVRLSKLGDSTTKFKNDKQREQNGKRQQSQQPQQQGQEQHSTGASTSNQAKPIQNYSNTTKFNTQQQPVQPQAQGIYTTPLGNGFRYDASKIVGFQSKETNELAMNLLKSQGILPQMTSGQPPQVSLVELQKVPPLSAASQPMGSYGAAPCILPSMQSHPMASHSLAPTSAGHAQPTLPLANVAPKTADPLTAPPLNISPFINYGMVHSANNNIPWKVGDICYAKYWDDEEFYEAEITGVSTTTCVVLFVGYGNYEEVLRSDCITVKDYQRLAHQTSSIEPHFNRGGGGFSGIGGSHRYRNERPMYVPPPKRDN